VIAVCRNRQDAERRQRNALEDIRNNYEEEDNSFESGESYLTVNEEDYYNVEINSSFGDEAA
jgi:hypothetical protein